MDDKEYMKMAMELAEKGRGWTSPNPLVGAVIVKDGKIIGQGYHEYFGGPHAEVNAVRSSAEDVSGATIYVTLEPCSHVGKTPPCADLLIRSGFKKVVVGSLDPNELVSGKGVKRLREYGIEVETGVLEKECLKQNEVFMKYIIEKQPFTVMKSAMSLDGKIATSSGESRWITGEAARKNVHRLRHELMGILVGIGTVLEDDPQLTAREEGMKSPIRIIVDSKLRIPLTAKVLQNQDEAQTIIATTEKADAEKLTHLKEMGIEVILTPGNAQKVELKELMNHLGAKGIDSVLLEGGAELNDAALKAGIVDKVQIYIAPKLIGGKTAKTPVGGTGIGALTEAHQLAELQTSMFGPDLLVEGYIKKEIEDRR